MPNPGHTRPGSLRPGFTRLPDGRGRMVVFAEKLASGEQFRAGLALPRGTLYSEAERVDCSLERLSHLVGLRLVEDGTRESAAGWHYVRTYEDLHPTDETPVGRPRVLRLPDGRIDVIQEWLQFSTARAQPQAVGLAACPVWPLELATVSGSADTDLLELPAHGLLAGDVVRFTALEGGDGLATATDYHVRDVTIDAFKLSATAGGAAVNLTTDLVSGTLLQQVPALRLVEEDAPDDGTLRRIRRRYSTTRLGAPEPSLETRVTERLVNFTYPGQLKAFTETFTVGTGDTRKMLDVYRRPPVTIKVRATVTVSYTTTPTLGTITPALWNPTEWATVRQQWVGFGNRPYNQVDTYPGYRSSTGSQQSETATAATLAPLDVSISGNPVYGGTTARITINGGPGSPGTPGSNTWTLDVDISAEPVLADAAGTKYYRKTQVTATIPAEPSLPV